MMGPLSWLVLAPLVGALILLFFPASQTRYIKIAGIGFAAVPAVLAGVLYAGFRPAQEGFQFVEGGTWFTLLYPFARGDLGSGSWQEVPIAYGMGVDGLSLPLVLLAATVGFLAAVASVRYTKRIKEYFIFFLLLQSGTLGAFATTSTLWFFIFFEVVLVTSFFLIGIWGSERREEAAYQFLIYNGIGSLLMLLGFVWIFNTVLSFEVPEIVQRLGEVYLSPGTQAFVFALLFLGFAVKLPMFPFHTWMLRAHTEAPPAMSMILSGVLLKLGAYGMLRFAVGFFPEVAYHAATFLVLMGLINLLYGAFAALVQKSLKMVIVYSSLSHMGLVLLGIAAFNFLGFQGAVFQMVSHGLIAALLFFLAGVFTERFGTTEFSALGGIGKKLPYLSGVLLVAAMASLGLPLMAGFVSELQVYLGLFTSALRTYAWIALLGLVLTAAYWLRAVTRATFGPLAPGTERRPLSDLRFAEWVPALVLIGLIVFLGVYPAALSVVIAQGLAPFSPPVALLP